MVAIEGASTSKGAVLTTKFNGQNIENSAFSNHGCGISASAPPTANLARMPSNDSADDSNGESSRSSGGPSDAERAQSSDSDAQDGVKGSSQRPSKQPRLTLPTPGSDLQGRVSRFKSLPLQIDAPNGHDKINVGPDTSANPDFASLNVKPWLVAALKTMQITRPTGIQRACIPIILEGRDCIGGSKTGSGKTVAFAVPILQKWSEDPFGIFAVVLTPTRELALQILEQFKAISAPQALKVVLIIGGADMREQALALSRRPHVIIATPGRLADHIRVSGEDTICGLRRVRIVVLDEADRLLESGSGSMLPAVEECLSVLPPPAERQTLLFTATVTAEVRALKERPRTPGRPEVFISEVDTETLAIPSTLSQKYLQVPVTHRESFLHVLLNTPLNLPEPTIIFCNRTATANLLNHLLRLLDHRVTALHSALPQRQRIDNLGRFRASAARILVATDVAARGLDIPEVRLVINYDVPRDPDDYIHRVGRTARAGRSGTAITMVGQRDVELVLAIERRVGRQMEEFKEEGVSVEGRVVKEALKVVGEKKREAMLDVEEGREVGGKRKRGMVKLRVGAV